MINEFDGTGVVPDGVGMIGFVVVEFVVPVTFLVLLVVEIIGNIVAILFEAAISGDISGFEAAAGVVPWGWTGIVPTLFCP